MDISLDNRTCEFKLGVVECCVLGIVDGAPDLVNSGMLWLRFDQRDGIDIVMLR